jgi:hypothetical protein
MRVPPVGITDDLVIQLTSGWNAFIGSNQEGVAAFFLQERLKGRFLLPSTGSAYSGWRLTEDYFDPSENIPFRTPTPTEASEITPTNLKTFTVFDPGFTLSVFPNSDVPFAELRLGAPTWIESLTGNSEAIASLVAEENREQLLADIFPARTLPVGGNPIATFAGRNLDMQLLFHVGWPSSRIANNEAIEWRHSDIRLVAYTYIYPLFDSFVELGALK